MLIPDRISSLRVKQSPAFCEVREIQFNVLNPDSLC